MSSDLGQSHSDLSHLSLGDGEGKLDRRDSSDSESLNNAMDETPDSLQDELSSMESQTCSSAAAEPPDATEETQSEEVTVTDEANAVKQVKEVSGESGVKGQSSEQKSAQDQKVMTAPDDTPNQQATSEESMSTTPQLGSGNETMATNANDEKTDKNKSKKNTVTNKEPTLDQNANVEQTVKQTGQTKQKGKGQQEQKQKPAAPEQKMQMVFGSQPLPKVSSKSYENTFILLSLSCVEDVCLV